MELTSENCPTCLAELIIRSEDRLFLIATAKVSSQHNLAPRTIVTRYLSMYHAMGHAPKEVMVAVARGHFDQQGARR